MQALLPLLLAQTTLQLDDGSLEQMWSLTSPNAGPNDWIGAGYTPPFEHPFRVVSATMYYLDDSCCSAGACSENLCLIGADWERRVIAAAELSVDPAGLTPNVVSPIHSQSSVTFMGPGSTRTAPPWTLTPDVWTLPAGTIFDHPGRIFYAIKYWNADSYMNFAVDNTGPSAPNGEGIYTSDGFATRAAIWSFGNVGMRIAIEPIFFLKIGSVPPQAGLTLDGSTAIPMLSLRAGGGTVATTVSRVRVTASGSGNDALGVQTVRLVHDANRNGAVDTGEVTLASGSYPADNGFVDLSPNRTIASGATEEWLVTYDFTTQPSGGQTFAARIAAAADVDSNLGDPFVSGTTNGTGAIVGPSITIAGRLSVSRGAASAPARVVAAGAADVSALQLRLTSYDETFSVTRLRFTASGSLNDLTEITNVRLYLDANGDGSSAGDALLSSGTFREDDGAIELSFGAVTVAANSSRHLLVTLDLSGGANGGDTVRLVLGAASDVGASGSSSGAIPSVGPRALSGTPVIGEFQTIGGALTAALGAANPPAGTAQPGATAIPMLQLQLTAQAEAVGLASITFTGSGSGNEALHVARARLFRDVNGNGLVDGGDVALGQPQSFSANDGIVTFAITGESVPASASRLYLVAYDFTGAPTGGETFSLRLASKNDVIASGQSSGAPIDPSGNFPLIGNVRTMLGGLSIAVGPENPPASNVQPGASDVPMLALRVAAQGETFAISSLALTGAGSLADDSGVFAVELWRDQGALGVRDAADTLIATSRYPSDDGVALFTFSRAIAAGAVERWLVTYDLQLAAQSGQTFRATIASGALIASGSISGTASPTGLPIAGNTQSIGGTLSIAPGPANPLGGSIIPGATGVVMLQARLTATLEPITVSGFTIHAAGSGNEMTSVASARLFVDADRDGVLDAVGDVPLGAARTYPMNDGRVSFSFPGRTIAAGAHEDWIVVYDVAANVAAGQTFSVSWLNPTDLIATAESGALPRANGAPIFGAAKTVLGLLSVARGPANPVARRVRRDAAGVPILQLRLTSQAEGFSIGSLGLSAAGSIDDVTDIAGLTLVLDGDGDGQRGANEPVLAGPVAFSADDGTVSFSAFSVMLAANASTDLLVLADLTGTARSGTTFRLNLAAGSLAATGFGGRSVTNTSPIGSDTITVGGTIDVALGPESPIARIVTRNEPSVPALQLQLRADVEPATLTSLTLHASGTGDDSAAIASVALYLDGDGNGRVGAGEPQLARGAFAQDDGALAFLLSQPIQVGPAIHLLAVVSMSAAPVGGETFSLDLDPAADLSVTSASNAVVVTGAPLIGAILTAGGGFSIGLGPQTNGGALVNQLQQNVAVLQLDLHSVNEACMVHSLMLRAFGSIDDAADVASIRLLYDGNDNGLVDFSDQPIGSASSYPYDDGTVLFTNLGRAMGTDASERWLVVYDLSGNASNLDTFAVRLEDDADVNITCNVSGPVIPTGAPIESATFTIQEDGALVIARGSETPPSLFLPAGSVKSPVLQLRAAATVQDLTLSRIALTATVGSGALSDTVARVSLFQDVNQDGLLDRTDRELSVGAAPDGAGRVEFNNVALPVPVADAAYLLATVDVASSAVPGTRFSIGLAVNMDLEANSSFGSALITGAPAFGEEMTVAGHLNLAAGPSLPKTVKNDEVGIEALAFSASAISETFHLRSITVTAEGTIDPAASVRGLTLVSEGSVVAEDVRFPEGSARTSFAGLDLVVAPGAPIDLAVIADLEGTARVDQTLVLSIAANVDVIASGQDVGLTSPIGAPIVGSPIAIGPSLRIEAGAAIADRIVAANAEAIPVLSFRATAFNEDVTLSRLSISTEGSLDDASAIGALRLLLDIDGDGAIDPEDVEVGRPAHPAGDDGLATFAPLAELLAKNASAHYLVAIDLSGAGSAGEEVRLLIANDGDLTAFGSESGAVAARGAPIAGARVTLVGALSVRLGPSSPPGVGVSAGSAFAALELEAFTQGEAVTIDQLALSLEGTADDAVAIREARLYRDVDEDGAIGEGDSIQANASPDGDNGLVTFAALGLAIDSDARALLLIEIELASEAAPGGTLRLVLESNDRVRATGASSGAVDAVGAPISGSAFTIVDRRDRGPSHPEDGCACSARKGDDRPPLAWLLLFALRRWRRRTADKPENNGMD